MPLLQRAREALLYQGQKCGAALAANALQSALAKAWAALKLPVNAVVRSCPTKSLGFWACVSLGIRPELGLASFGTLRLVRPAPLNRFGSPKSDSLESQLALVLLQIQHPKAHRLGRGLLVANIQPNHFSV